MLGRCFHWCLHGCGKTVTCERVGMTRRDKNGKRVMAYKFICSECKREYTKKQMLKSEGKTRWPGGKV